MRFEIAAFGVGRRIEIDHGRTFLQRIWKRKVKFFSRQGSPSRKIRGLIAYFERSQNGQGSQSGKCDTPKQFFHDKSLPGDQSTEKHITPRLPEGRDSPECLSNPQGPAGSIRSKAVQTR